MEVHMEPNDTFISAIDPPIGRPCLQQQVFVKKTARNKKQAKPAIVAVPLEEALRTEINTNNMKTPISVLQELLSRRGITPQYDLIQVEGAVHEPTFRYRVSYQDKDAMGTGKSKKEAKHAAAKALIDKLTGMSYNEQQTGQLIMKPENLNNHTAMSAEEEPTGNPIGWLQEMCMARRWPPPMYETEMEVGLPHERQFTIACVVLKFREVGEGKSKKVAKRQAAQKMWIRLQDQPMESNQIMQLLDEDGNEELRPSGIIGRFAGLKNATIPNLTTAHGQKVSQFHKTLKSRAGEALTNLQNTSLSDSTIDFILMLEDIASEQRFEVTYVDIDEKTHSGQFQCLVQLSTMPVAVCHGTGHTVRDAQLLAARNSLEYLKIMTKS
ncbi:interferon-inducible double-stranded RNA-dependent protein kinase activator A homolog B isoform X1 [Anopheles cruzii]|uniref:interferon-inducible double-stranded RNA-dependent protein kinase activator A homolog B isoform X1 n=1 Tax=Anopheles cruzii TaxID=68878 RepID=UPI0022EC1B8D|nr:interferon-inducible double-stranded RNA-dependent protein kinase activator A homolog B isoform X1 [Anopheles cruzii]